MSAEFMATMGDGSGYYTFEHDLIRQVACDADHIRLRLADALEQMGYRVLNDNPIQAKRSAKNGAASGCSSNILDYQTTLNVGIKSVGPSLSRVTFAYEIKGVYSGYMSKGDHNTLTREAEAIIAIAMAKTAAAHCSTCGAETAGSTRFCRKCGAPLNVTAPAETEVLRLMSGANSSQQNLGTGLFFLLIAGALLLILPFGSADPIKFAKLVRILGIVSSLLGGTGLVMLLYGWHKLRQLVNQPIEQDSLPTLRRNFVEGVHVPNTNELPPASIQHPVTEATTDLLHHEVKRAS
ncbi:MAG: zinc ribbon domain-containing protein [Acidobacteria bacterium]|nr:zinc ribbon domain-containing protein [Acidobacteriota bacterium]